MCKMKVEIWSDLVSPYCYMAKKNFESALSQFPYKDQVEVVMRSFPLFPEFEAKAGMTFPDMLMSDKGIDALKAEQITMLAQKLNAQFNTGIRLDRFVPANTAKAHRLLQFASQYGKTEALEEILSRNALIDGLNLESDELLIDAASKLNLPLDEVEKVLKSDLFEEQMTTDVLQALKRNVQTLPFILMNEYHAVSGAQDVEVFLSALNNAFTEFEQNSTQEKSKCEKNKRELCVDNNAS